MNMQPSEAEAGFDCRLPPTVDPDLLKKRIADEWAPAIRNMTYQVHNGFSHDTQLMSFYSWSQKLLIVSALVHLFIDLLINRLIIFPRTYSAGCPYDLDKSLHSLEAIFHPMILNKNIWRLKWTLQ